MSASPLSVLSTSSRSLEWLAGPGALLSSTAVSTGQLGSLGPIASLIEGAVDASSPESSSSLLPDALAATANQIILQTHAQIEDVGHQVAPANGPLHGLTNLGETLGLGHLGEGGNLLTDLGGVAANPTGTEAIAPLLNDAGAVAAAASSLTETVSAIPASGNGLIGSGSVLDPATGILNQAVLDLHVTLEDAGHQVPVLNAPIHAVTGLGETLGLGHLGSTGNVLTDLAALPGSLLGGGGLASATPVLSDLGHVLGSVDTLVGSLTGAASAGGLLSGSGLLAPVTNLANGAVLDIHATLENIGHEVPLLNDALHGLTNLGETLGLGHLGQDGNLVTDVVALPGDLLGGQGLGSLSPILGDVGAVTNAASGLLGGVTGVFGGLNGGAGTGGTGTLLGGGAPLQSVGDLANGLIDRVHAGIEQVGHDVPILNDTLHSVIGLGNTVGLGELGDTSNLLTDVANLPGAVLSGNGPAAVSQIAGDVGHVADAAGGVLGAVTGALDGVGGAGTGTPLDGVLAPVTGILGGGASTDPVGSLLGGLAGGAAGDPGTHPLVDVAAGPTTPTPGAGLAVLTPAADPAHAVEASAIAVPAEQPSLLHAGLFSGDSIVFPQTGGGGDMLVGHLLDIAPAAVPVGTDASHGSTIDLGIVAIDLGGHTDVTHADPTPHTATTGIHLLGL